MRLEKILKFKCHVYTRTSSAIISPPYVLMLLSEVTHTSMRPSPMYWSHVHRRTITSMEVSAFVITSRRIECSLPTDREYRPGMQNLHDANDVVTDERRMSNGGSSPDDSADHRWSMVVYGGLRGLRHRSLPALAGVPPSTKLSDTGQMASVATWIFGLDP